VNQEVNRPHIREVQITIDIEMIVPHTRDTKRFEIAHSSCTRAPFSKAPGNVSPIPLHQASLSAVVILSSIKSKKAPESGDISSTRGGEDTVSGGTT